MSPEVPSRCSWRHHACVLACFSKIPASTGTFTRPNPEVYTCHSQLPDLDRAPDAAARRTSKAKTGVTSCHSLDIALKFVVKRQDRCHVAASIAVVRRTPHCDQALVAEHVLEPFLDQLVRSTNEFQSC
jgi:hypothetical protein